MESYLADFISRVYPSGLLGLQPKPPLDGRQHHRQVGEDEALEDTDTDVEGDKDFGRGEALEPRRAKREEAACRRSVYLSHCGFEV